MRQSADTCSAGRFSRWGASDDVVEQRNTQTARRRVCDIRAEYLVVLRRASPSRHRRTQGPGSCQTNLIHKTAAGLYNTWAALQTSAGNVRHALAGHYRTISRMISATSFFLTPHIGPATRDTSRLSEVSALSIARLRWPLCGLGLMSKAGEARVPSVRRRIHDCVDVRHAHVHTERNSRIAFRGRYAWR